jgi:hypothetical protein
MSAQIVVRARLCPFDPNVYAGQPIGQFHCPVCGCMVIAAVDHGVCVPGLCPALDEGDHPGEEIDYTISREDAELLGLVEVTP